MRFVMTCLLSAALLFTGATSASAFEYFFSAPGYGGEALDVGDSVAIDMHIDMQEVGLQLLSIGVLFDPVELAYNGQASEDLPPQGPGSSGAAPSYILYMAGKPATVLYPTQYPQWIPWPVPPAGKGQININFSVPSLLNPAQATGTDIYVASMVFDVVAEGDGTALLEACVTCGGNVLRINNVTIPPGTIPVQGSPIVVTVPEPTMAALGVAALLACGYVARRRSRA